MWCYFEIWRKVALKEEKDGESIVIDITLWLVEVVVIFLSIANENT
jgi:hypothetical protein